MRKRLSSINKSPKSLCPEILQNNLKRRLEEKAAMIAKKSQVTKVMPTVASALEQKFVMPVSEQLKFVKLPLKINATAAPAAPAAMSMYDKTCALYTHFQLQSVKRWRCIC